MTSPIAGTAGYTAEAEALADQYESVDFETVHRDVLHLIPAFPSRILDVGAGSGRDAAALAARGHAVVAVEPAEELRREGERCERFDVILLSAVWMHLDEPERRVAVASLSALLAPQGVAILSLRHGPVPAGRRMFDVTADETVALAASVGLACRHRDTRRDPHDRDGVTWSVLALAREA